MVSCIVDEIFSIFRDFGSQTYGEDVSQMEHILQCGQLARQDNAPDTLIAAALMHDIGQFISDAGNAAELHGVDARHEITGADYLAANFPEAVTEPVRLHVDAKRYLCAVEAGYIESLSRASSLSLKLQGGPMDAQEIADFLAKPAATDAIRLRRYDDTGKKRNWDVPDLESYRPLLETLAKAHIEQS